MVIWWHYRVVLILPASSGALSADRQHWLWIILILVKMREGVRVCSRVEEEG